MRFPRVRLPIFSRLVIGYLAILVMMTSVSLYGILSLRQFTGLTRSLLDVDSRILEYESKLRDTLLSEIQYEKKFLIGKDTALYDRFLLFNSDFEQYLKEVGPLAETPEAAALLTVIDQQHQRYTQLFSEEIRLLDPGQKYSQEAFRQAKDRAADGILDELRKLRAQSQNRISEKVNRLDEAGTNAGRVALMMILACVILGIAVALLITRSITHPIAILKRKTAEIARGHFGGDLNLRSPPEIADLAADFDFMCNQLKDLDRMKSDFFSMMSHELRTPLTSIKEGIGLLLDGVGGSISEKQQKLLHILDEESHRMITLISSLLDLSKMEAGMMTYRFEPVRLPELVCKVVTELMPLVEAKKITLESKIDTEFSMIKMDQERVLQVLRNLIGNAIKFTPKGGRVNIAARMTDGKAEISVRDTGPGIPEGDLGRIFDKYQQAPVPGAHTAKGTGLGLAIAKHTILAHGGKIWAESEPGRGSSFIFVLPA